MRVCAILAAAALAVGTAGASQVVIDFETASGYVVGDLAGQQGWAQIAGTDSTAASVDALANGPSLPGAQSVMLSNAQSEIRLEKAIEDVSATGGPIVTLQYDVMNMTNMDAGDGWGQPTTFRARLYGDDGQGTMYSPVGNMHFDGGGGPASQVWASSTADNLTGGWATDSNPTPAWTDLNWHTVMLKLDYANELLVSLTFDGAETVFNSPAPWYFYDWNAGDPGGVAQGIDVLRMWLFQNDNNDQWRVDNFVITGVPEPASLLLLACGALTALRRRL